MIFMHFVQYGSFALLGVCVCVLLYNNGDRWNYSRETFKEGSWNGTKEYMMHSIRCILLLSLPS